MELNDLITLIIFFIIFVLPSVFKGRGKKKKSPSRVKKKKASLFGKLGDVLQEFKRELEKQAMEAKRKAEAEKGGTVWDEMAEEEIELVPAEELPSPVPVKKRAPEYYDPELFVSPEKAVIEPVPVTSAEIPSFRDTGLPELNGSQTRLPLQQAVVWSEILGKPAALKND